MARRNRQHKLSRRFSTQFHAYIACIPKYELDDLLSRERPLSNRLRDYDDEPDDDLGCG